MCIEHADKVGIRKVRNGDLAGFRQYYFDSKEQAQAFVDKDWDGDYKTHYLIRHIGESFYGHDIEPKGWKADEYESHIKTTIKTDTHGNQHYVHKWVD